MHIPGAVHSEDRRDFSNRKSNSSLLTRHRSFEFDRAKDRRFRLRFFTASRAHYSLADPSRYTSQDITKLTVLDEALENDQGAWNITSRKVYTRCVWHVRERTNTWSLRANWGLLYPSELLRQQRPREACSMLKRATFVVPLLTPRAHPSTLHERLQTRTNKHSNFLLSIVSCRGTKSNAGHGTPKETFREIFHACEKIWMFNSVYGHAVEVYNAPWWSRSFLRGTEIYFNVTYLRAVKFATGTERQEIAWSLRCFKWKRWPRHRDCRDQAILREAFNSCNCSTDTLSWYHFYGNVLTVIMKSTLLNPSLYSFYQENCVFNKYTYFYNVTRLLYFMLFLKQWKIST